MLNDFYSLIFPKTCINCRRSLTSVENFICLGCKIDLPLTEDSQNPENVLYQKFAFERKVKSASAFLYFQRKGITQKLLHEIKYRGKNELAIQLGKWMSSSFSKMTFDLILPVPLHRSKKRMRTYNQSEQLASGISEELNIELRDDLIRRVIATETQTRKSKLKRWKNMENVYSSSTENLAGQSVLIVDDVITTGATVGMLCDRLVEANVSEIHIASLARGQ